MSSKSATTDPRAFSLSFALAACSRSFFCNFSSYVSGASAVGSGLGARVKVTSTCIVKRAESAACEANGFCPVSWPQWSRFCPVPTGWVPSDLSQPGLSPRERQAGHQSRWARTEAKQRPSSAPTQGGALATSHGPNATQEPWPQGHSGRAPPTSMKPWVESGIVSGVATPGVQFLSRASPGWREGWGWGWGWGWGEGWGWAWGWA